MKTKKISAAERERNESIAALRKILKRGDTVYTVLRKVAPSGMSREIDLYVFRGARGDKKLYLSGYASTILGIPRSRDGHWALKVRGGGMDMGFDLVYSLSWAIFGKPGSKSDAGHALKHEWI